MITYAERPWIKSYDDGLPTSIDFPDIPLHQFIKDTTKRIPHQTALVTPAALPLLGRISKETSYAELDRASDALAAALVDLGLKKGDRVGASTMASKPMSKSWRMTWRFSSTLAGRPASPRQPCRNIGRWWPICCKPKAS